ncbi:MAG: four helix bundle protein [Chloroflexi bacterium]|nr:four helix bundle protein [Chloroflexota bacterium]
MARDFKKIIVWQKADDLAVAIYGITHSYFPDAEKYGLTSQIRRAAVSVAANIAEGSGRHTPADFLRFLGFAQGSLSEVEYHLHLAHRLGYVDDAVYQNLEDQRAEVGRVLTGFIKAVRKQKNA